MVAEFKETPEQTAEREANERAAKERQHLADCKAERERIKAIQQARWDREAAEAEAKAKTK